MPRTESDRVSFLESPAPKGIRRDLAPAYQAMSRLKNGGLNPDFVIDVGSSTGAWSDAVQRIFENARFVLADPLISKYVQPAEAPKTSGHAGFERVEAAVSNRAGKADFQVSPELRGSSLSRRPDCPPGQSVEVQVVTIDQLAKDKGISGRGILRINAPGAERLVLEGAARFLSQIDVVVIWVSLADGGAEAKSFSGMLVFMEDLGFRYFDDAGDWRSPVDGTLLRKEAVFLRNGLLTSPPAA
jgi:FkbM family methyltransferase